MTEDEKKDVLYLAYKPLRNHLKKLGIPDSLYVIWHYLRHLRSGSLDFPEIEVSPEFLEADYVQKRRGISEWELEILIREIFINGWSLDADQKTLRKGNYFAGAVNKLKNVSGAIAANYISTENVLREIHRLSHHQFIWMIKRPTMNSLTRYYKIFSRAGLDEMMEDHFELKLQEIYMFACAVWGYFQNRLALDYPPQIQLLHLTPDDFDRFVQKFAKDLAELREEMVVSRRIDDRFLYAFNPLRQYPLVRMKYYGKDSIVCPDPTILYWRLTDGIYYELFHKKGFGELFGASFESYVGEVLEKTCGNFTVLKEQEYDSKKGRKRSIDWIVDAGRDALFIECKTKRMQHDAKTELLSDEVQTEDLEKMADFVVQAYKSIRDYKGGEYPHLTYRQRRRVYPMIVTLEDWLIFGDDLTDQLDDIVRTKMLVENLPLWYLDTMPYSICSVQAFENIIQVIAEKGIHDVIADKYRDADKKYWDYSVYARDKYPEEWKNCTFLFEEDFEKILPPQFY